MPTVAGLKGSLYQRGETWWIKLRQHGRVIRESSGSSDRTKAEKLLLKRNAALEEGRTINERLNKCKVDRLLDLVLTQQATDKRKDRLNVERRIRKHVRPAFGWRLAVSVTSETVRQYIAKRQATGAAAATINHEIGILARAFKLGLEARLVDQVPVIKDLDVHNAREGHFRTLADFERVIACLPTRKGANVHLAPLLRFAYHTGWRKAEILGLTWNRVDFEKGTVRLAAGTTKNNKPRLCPFTPELRALLEAQRAHTDAVNRERGILCQWVFHRDGKQIRDFYAAWRTACTAAGQAGRLLHDCRRTAARNLRLAGISEQVAMKFTGHETAEMYRRYDIFDDDDMTLAAEQLAAYQAAQVSALATGHNPGTTASISEARSARGRR